MSEYLKPGEVRCWSCKEWSRITSFRMPMAIAFIATHQLMFWMSRILIFKRQPNDSTQQTGAA